MLTGDRQDGGPLWNEGHIDLSTFFLNSLRLCSCSLLCDRFYPPGANLNPHLAGSAGLSAQARSFLHS
jgi:hypothetical protein